MDSLANNLPTLVSTGSPSARAPEMRGRRLLVVSSFDSFLKTALPIADAFRHAGYLSGFVLAEGRAWQISTRQLADLGLHEPIETLPLSRIAASNVVMAADVVLLALDGARSAEFLHRFRQQLEPTARKRPILVTGYPGVIFQAALHGMANRSGADLVLLNSPADHAEYTRFCARFQMDAEGGICFGLPILASAPRARPVANPPRSILYIEQPDVPRQKIERLYLIDRLIGYARHHPGRRVVIKPRHRPGETTLKRTTFHLEPIVRRVERSGGLPPNLHLVYDPIERLLDEIDLCLTVSSTAALQAAALGVPFVSLADFGIRDDYGVHFFLESGCLGTFDDVLDDRIPELSATWRARHVLPAAPDMGLLVHQVEALLARQEAAGAALPLRRTPLDAARLAFFRYRFDAPDASWAAARRAAFARHQPAKATSFVVNHAIQRKWRKLRRAPRAFLFDLWHKRFGHQRRAASSQGLRL